MGRSRRAVDGLQRGAQVVGEGSRRAGVAVHVDVHEVALGGGDVFALAEDAELVAHAAGAQVGHAHTDLHRLRKGERAVVAAPRLHHQADHGARGGAGDAAGGQEAVDGGVEERVVDHVVHVAVRVVVHPPRRQREEVGELAARGGRAPGHRGTTTARATTRPRRISSRMRGTSSIAWQATGSGRRPRSRTSASSSRSPRRGPVYEPRMVALRRGKKCVGTVISPPKRPTITSVPFFARIRCPSAAVCDGPTKSTTAATPRPSVRRISASRASTADPSSTSKSPNSRAASSLRASRSTKVTRASVIARTICAAISPTPPAPTITSSWSASSGGSLRSAEYAVRPAQA